MVPLPPVLGCGLFGDCGFLTIPPLVRASGVAFVETGWWAARAADLLHRGSPCKEKIFFLGFSFFSHYIEEPELHMEVGSLAG